MNITPIKTPLFSQDTNLIEFLTAETKSYLSEGSILVVTSKLLSLHQNRIIPKEHANKLKLIKQESDRYIGASNYGHHLTIKNNLIMPTAGIDESNGNNNLLLLPIDIHKTTQTIYEELSIALNLKKWGIVVSDSKTSPMRRGVTGVSLSYYGFEGVESLKGRPDLFDNKIKITCTNKVDALAAAAVSVMGESNEQQPLCLIKNYKVNFKIETTPSLYIEPEDCIYSALLSK